MKLKEQFFILLFSSISLLFSSEKIGYVYYFDGNSYIKNIKVNLYDKEAFTGRAVYSGDVIKVKNDAVCSIFFDDEKTQLIIDGNSSVQIIQTDLSKEIKINQGSLYIHNLLELDEKVYVFTDNNQYYLENDRAWISSNYSSGDVLFSLDHSINVYNNVNNYSTLYENDKVNYFFNTGNILHSNIVENIVPEYVLEKNNKPLYEITTVSLNKYDLIPIYGRRIREEDEVSAMKYSYGMGSTNLNDGSYLSLGFYPRYKSKDLTIAYSFEPYFDENNELLEGDWDDLFDVVDRLKITYFHRNHDKNNQMILHYGNSNNITFGEGYLLNSLSNIIDYPRVRNSGLFIDYRFDQDFINFQLAIPSMNDLMSSGGMIAARTSLFVSHRFPLTLGLGIIADFNQMSYIKNHYDLSINKNRSIYGLEFDYSYDLPFFKNIDISIYGELAGLWYPDITYYKLFDVANQIGNDLRYRKGVWGIKGPGLSMRFNDKINLKLAFNQNSALFIPSYFNSNYLMNRTRYYQGDLDFPLVNQQIDLLNQFLIEGQTDQYFIPKDLYPLLEGNQGFSVYKVSGFSYEINYDIRNYLSFMISSAVYVEDSSASESYYSLETSIKIKEDFIRNISFINLYYSNIFFKEMSDKARLSYGLNLGIDLPLRLSLIFDVGQVYYNANLTDNNLDQMINTGICLKYNF